MPGRILRMQCPDLCRRHRAMEAWAQDCHRREILLLMPRANNMGHPAINQRAGCPTMTLHLLSRAPLLPRPRALHPDTNPHFRFQTARISFFLLPQNSSPTSRLRPLRRRLTMGNMIIPRPSRNRKSMNPTALPRATRAQQLNGIGRAGRANLEGGEADSPVIRRRNGISLRLPARNWFAGEFPQLRAGRSS